VPAGGLKDFEELHRVEVAALHVLGEDVGDGVVARELAEARLSWVNGYA
jgi:hypothetical protein